MDVKRIISELDSEISRLQDARNALAGLSGTTGGRRGGRRKLSAAARARIAAAQRARWAKVRKAQKA